MKINELNEEIKKAMKEKNKEVLDALRTFKAELETLAKNKKSEITDEFFDDFIIKYTKRISKVLNDVKYKTKTEFLEKAKKEMEILSNFAPKMLSKEDIKKAIDKILEANENLQKKQIIGKIKKTYGMYADGKVIMEVLSKILK